MKKEKPKEVIECCICGKEFQVFSANNPYPVMKEGKCCSACALSVVLAARIALSTGKIKVWNVEEMTGYKPITTLYQDFGIADLFGEKAIKDTYKRVTSKDGFARMNYKYMIELVMVLNWKIWEHAELKQTYAILYDELWRKAQDIVFETFSKQELSEYFRITD